mmetsp:Transcript_8120/g.21495  ORF Transcript_8120/g.21495 Transcript_8120/m.21495 type:complete len:249 (-) Transcript_8120:422-1168(-)
MQYLNRVSLASLPTVIEKMRSSSSMHFAMSFSSEYVCAKWRASIKMTSVLSDVRDDDTFLAIRIIFSATCRLLPLSVRDSRRSLSYRAKGLCLLFTSSCCFKTSSSSSSSSNGSTCCACTKWSTRRQRAPNSALSYCTHEYLIKRPISDCGATVISSDPASASTSFFSWSKSVCSPRMVFSSSTLSSALQKNRNSSSDSAADAPTFGGGPPPIAEGGVSCLTTLDVPRRASTTSLFDFAATFSFSASK